MSKETGGPAFPTQINNSGITPIKGFNGEEIKPQTFSAYPGMTLRDYFAAHSAEVSDEISIQYAEKIVGRKMPDFAAMPLDNAAFWAEYRAIMRYIEADAMLAARVKP